MKLVDFYDKRLYKGCRLFPSCINCTVYCKWHKVKLSEEEINKSTRHSENKRKIKKHWSVTRRIDNPYGYPTYIVNYFYTELFAFLFKIYLLSPLHFKTYSNVFIRKDGKGKSNS